MKHKTTNKRNTLNVLVVCIILMATLLTACSSEQAATTANDETTKAEVTEEAPAVEQAEEATTPEPTEEPTPEPTTEPVEMVSWEEWASQPGEEEPHLVVWNEKKGKQLIIKPDSEYTLEEGDRLAVSATMSIESLNEMSAVVVIKDGGFTQQNVIETGYGQYVEVDIQKEGKNKIVYTFKGTDYDYIVVK